METSAIKHIVVIPSEVSETNCSFFQGFSYQVLYDYNSIFSALSFAPHDLFELFINNMDYAASKMAGSILDINLIKEDLIDDEHIDFNGEFNILWSTRLTLNSTNKILHKFNFEPIHISTEKDSSCIYIGDLTESMFLELFRDLVKKIYSLNPNCEYKELLEKLVKIESPCIEKKIFPFPPLRHNCVHPLRKTLQSYGYYSDETEEVRPNLNIYQHIEGIVKLAKLVEDIRKQCDLPSFIVKNDAIIYCPSIFALLYKTNSRLWEDLYRKLKKSSRNFLKQIIIRNKGYGNSWNIVIDSEENFNPYKDEIIGPLLQERQAELRLFTNIVSIVAVNQFCPAIRLPNSVMLHHDSLKNIADLIKNANKKNIRVLNKKISAYSEALKNDIGTDLINTSLIDKDKLFAICDFPIEWISLNGFPLMFTHEISRVCSTPGNLFAQMVLSGQRMLIPYKAFKNILILRSFKDNDPVREHLKFSVDQFDRTDCYKNLDINFIDVNSVNELVETLNSFTGLIAIFDCHGSHGGENGFGWLNIGNEKIDVWQLGNKCRIPPIVILSACSTHPIDGSHASVANGFFRCGALSVVGTYAPVTAIHSGIFVARLLYRISDFVPLIIKDRPFTWREIVSGFLKMSYSTDILRGMRYDLQIITDKQYNDIHIKSNCIINSYQPNWTSEFVRAIEQETSMDIEKIKRIIQDNFQFTETMLYSQLGRPENISIYNDE